MKIILDSKLLKKFRGKLSEDNTFAIAQGAALTNKVADVAANPDEFNKPKITISNQVTPRFKPMKQNASMHCWIVSGLNLFMLQMQKEDPIFKNTKLSISYIVFVSKLEAANTFFHQVLKTANMEYNEGEALDYFADPMDDGGNWSDFVALIEKYGVVPDEVFKKNITTRSSSEMNHFLEKFVFAEGMKLRHMKQDGASERQITKRFKAALEGAHRILSIHFGMLPEKFVFETPDKEHSAKELTPHHFFRDIVKVDLEDYIKVAHYDKTLLKHGTIYETPRSGIWSDNQETFMNIPTETLKKAAIASIKDNHGILFSSHMSENQIANMELHLDDNIHQYATFYGLLFDVDKTDLIKMHKLAPTHDAILTGVNLNKGKSDQWEFANTWGEKGNEDRYCTCSDEWFETYMVTAIIHKKYLSDEIIAANQKKPTKTPPNTFFG